jgi:hypothetical protein
MQWLRFLLEALGFEAQLLPGWQVLLGGLALVIAVVVIGVIAYVGYTGIVIVVKHTATQRARARAEAASAALAAAQKEEAVKRFTADSERQMSEMSVNCATKKAQLQAELAQAETALREAKEGPIRAAREAEQRAVALAEDAKTKVAEAERVVALAKGEAEQALSRAQVAEDARRQAWIDVDSMKQRERVTDGELEDLRRQVANLTEKATLGARIDSLAAVVESMRAKG